MIFGAQGHVTQKWLIRPELFERVRDFMQFLVTIKFDEDSMKNERVSLETPFSHYKYMGFS